MNTQREREIKEWVGLVFYHRIFLSLLVLAQTTVVQETYPRAKLKKQQEEEAHPIRSRAFSLCLPMALVPSCAKTELLIKGKEISSDKRWKKGGGRGKIEILSPQGLV